MRRNLLSIIILIFSAFLLADGVQPTGSGTEADPYQVEILDNLLWISTNNVSWDKHFIQINDIDATNTQNWNAGEGFSPIGNETISFSGNYNGQNHLIEGFFINRPSENYQGLLGYTQNATIENLGLNNISVTGLDYIGGLTGYNPNSIINNCFSSGVITGNGAVGGLVGWNNFTPINSSYSSGSVVGNFQVGGLLGANYFETIISNSYSFADVQGDDVVGGLIGQNGYSTIQNCFSIGNVVGNTRVGGLIGYCYNSSFENSFWNIDTSGQSTSSGGTGKTTLELKTLSTFIEAGWDFVDNPLNDIGNDDYWNMDGINNDGYPFLSWQHFPFPLAAYFTTNQVCTNQGYSIQFTDLSTGIPISWYWDFDNDGLIDSEEQNPEWIYEDSGIYSISLTIEDEVDTSTSIKENYLIIITNVQPDGNGTEASPYIVGELGNLVWLSSIPVAWDKYFIQTSDIDASSSQDWYEGKGFPAIGISIQESFCGHYNGQNHTIDQLFINNPDSRFQGLFGFAHFATIENIRVTNVNITGEEYCGGLAGRSQSSTVTNCFSSGFVNGETSIGGLVGHNHIDSFINNCISTVSVSGSTAGGLVGYNQWSSTINNSYSRGNVEGSESLGGLVGYNGGSSNYNSYIDNCYSTSNVIGSGSYIGGLIGCDNYGGVTTNSFWDTDISGIITSAGGTGKTTLEMKNVSTYTSLSTPGLDFPWDFVGNPFDDFGNEDIWDIDEEINDGYPFLTISLVGVQNEEIININEESNLLGNYPNPFNPTTTINFSIQNNSQVKLTIYNIKGQKLKTLTNNLYEKGYHSIIWYGNDDFNNSVGSGVYMYKLNVNGKIVAVRKCLLLK